MGQKVNPHGLRVGIIKDWDSKWYDDPSCSDFLIEDYVSTGKIGHVKDWGSCALRVKRRSFIMTIMSRIIPRIRLRRQMRLA